MSVRKHAIHFTVCYFKRRFKSIWACEDVNVKTLVAFTLCVYIFKSLTVLHDISLVANTWWKSCMCFTHSDLITDQLSHGWCLQYGLIKHFIIFFFVGLCLNFFVTASNNLQQLSHKSRGPLIVSVALWRVLCVGLQP